MSESAKHYEEAKKRVDQIKKFYKDLVGILCVAGVLVFINLQFSPGFHWFWFPVIAMSIGVITDYVKVFGLPFSGGFLGPDWEERRILEEMQKLEEGEDHIKWLAERNKDKLELNSADDLDVMDLDAFEDLPDLKIEKLRSEDNKH